MTVHDALASYLEARDIVDPGTPPDRLYASNWVYTKLHGRKIPIFPIHALKKPTLLHDLNHMISGCEPNWRGEFEVAGWELASGGCGRFVYVWLDRVIYFVLGLVLAPVSLVRGFRKGWGRRNAYHLDPDAVLGMELAELHRFMRVPT